MAKGKLAGKVISNLGVDGGSSAVSGAFEKIKMAGRKYVDAMQYDTQNIGPRMAATFEQDAKRISHEIGKAKRAGLSDNYIRGMQRNHAKTTALKKSVENANGFDEVANAMAGVELTFNGTDNIGMAKGMFSMSKNLAKDYYWSGANKAQRTARIGTTAAAIGAGQLGIRYMSGGTAMYNSKGERDIAGVPFM